MGKYTRLFIDETRGYLTVLERTLDAAGQGGAGRAALSESCRLSHSIKGMALFEEQQSIADLAYALEKGFRHGEAEGVEASLAEGLVKGVRLLGTLIDEVEREGRGISDPQALVLEIERRAGSEA